MLIFRMLPDQAVKSLCDTWHPDDIPTVFTACGRESLCAQPEPPTPHAESPLSPSLMAAGISNLFSPRNTQLPSPVSPTSRPSPPAPDGCESYTQAPASSGDSNLIPIKGFVHEVLRRSRTSTGVLQTALCYLEAVRAKVPECLRKEKACPTSDRHTEDEAEPRIIQGTPELHNCQVETVDAEFTAISDKNAGPTLDTIRVDDADVAPSIGADLFHNAPPSASRSKESSSPLPPMAPLPSPLCCPRRTFLACLILASKFMQDRSYSNRAWAKLAGLPPREIGRCERAVGEALEWRLWVGKLPTSSTSAGMPGSSGRGFGRTRSDGDLLVATNSTCTSPTTAAWAAGTAAGVEAQVWTPSAQAYASIPTPLPTPRTTRTMRRSATVPAFGSAGSAAPVDPFLAAQDHSDKGISQYNINMYYDAQSAPGPGSESSMDVEPQTEVSPLLSTPTLAYSPMSSASSSSSDGSEERTIQMSMFVDLPTPSLSYATTAYSSVGPWVANTTTYPPMDPANPFRSAAHINSTSYAPSYAFSNTSYATEAGAADCDNGTAHGSSPTKMATQVPPPLPPPGTATVTLPSFAEAFAGHCPGPHGHATR
ncbi:hypothetical protein C8Q77DRAFT_257912 [Trametes polyzona]|nr:hypothetical protein C8Q77DRAFT_257912 [Trametes polyzona]